MNIKNINDTLALLRRVEELETQYKTTLFRMETWGYNLPPSIQDLEADLHNEARCQTAGCIAGWACVAGKYFKSRKQNLPLEQFANSYLGLNDDQSSSLFYADEASSPRAWITTAQAIRALETLRDTGRIDWDDVLDLPFIN